MIEQTKAVHKLSINYWTQPANIKENTPVLKPETY